jgi:hypothetical protein
MAKEISLSYNLEYCSKKGSKIPKEDKVTFIFQFAVLKAAFIKSIPVLWPNSTPLREGSFTQAALEI